MADWKQKMEDIASSSVYAIYDFAAAPVTFDILQFIECAEMARRQAGFKRINFILVLDEDASFRQKTYKDHTMSHEEKMWRVRQILMPACWLVDSCAQVSLFTERSEFARYLTTIPRHRIYHPKYHIDNPQIPVNPVHVLDVFRGTGQSPLVFKASPYALTLTDRWISASGLDGKRIVALTVRNSRLEPERNGDKTAWQQFADTIAAEGYSPVFVPDTDQVFDQPGELNVGQHPAFWPGPVNLELRAALYERSYACLSDNGAGAWIHQWMPDSNSITFQPPSKVPVALRDGGAQEITLGIKRGEQFPFFTSTQWFCWEDDTYDDILKQFRMLEEAIATKAEASKDARI